MTRWPFSRRREKELDEELRTHLAMAERDRIARGESPDAARAAARREFGNVGLIKEITREIWGGQSLERLVQDLRYAMRSILRHDRATSAVIVLTLALGIAATSIMFGVVDQLLLRPPAGIGDADGVRRLYFGS